MKYMIEKKGTNQQRREKMEKEEWIESDSHTLNWNHEVKFVVEQACDI